MTQIRIYHQTDRGQRFEAYVPGNTLTEVFSYDDPITGHAPGELAERAYEVCNSSPGEYFGAGALLRRYVDEYRLLGNRSLSVGDVVVVGDGLTGLAAFAIASGGTNMIDVPEAALR
jgi:hypothetical protein